jgi:hypothetical protein
MVQNLQLCFSLPFDIGEVEEFLLDNPTGDLLLDFLVGVGEGPTQLVQHVVL